MTEPIAAIARASAHRLADRYGPRLPGEVEAALHATNGPPSRYADPVAIGGLIVAVASLAWTIYQDRKQRTPQPPQQVIIRSVRLELPASPALEPDERDRIIEAVVQQMLNVAEHEQPEP